MSRRGGLWEQLEAGRRLLAQPAALRGGAPDALPPLAADVGLRPDAVLVVPAGGQVVFRLLGRSAAREWDFQSARDRDRPPQPGRDFLDYIGLSVFASEHAALAAAVRFPKIVARVHLPAGEGFVLARTVAAVAEHYSVWGDPRTLRARVVEITRVDDEQGYNPP
jgi:hypothetical protein